MKKVVTASILLGVVVLGAVGVVAFGFIGGFQGEQPQTPTSTPTPTSTQQDTDETPSRSSTPGTQTPKQTPAGIGAESINSDVLVTQHLDVIERAGSITASYEASFLQPGGKTVIRERHVSANRGKNFLINRSTPSENRIVWANETKAVIRQGIDSYNYSVIEREAVSENLYFRPTLSRLLNSGEFRRGESTDGYLFVSNSAASGASVSLPGENITSYNATLRLRADGSVESLQVSYQATFDGEPTTVNIKLTYSEFGSTTVDKPDWVTGVQNDAYVVDAQLENRTIVVTNTGQKTIPNGTAFAVVTKSDYLQVVLNEKVTSGETIYLYKLDEETLVASRSRQPDDFGSQFNRSDYALIGVNGDTELFRVILRD